MSQKIVLLVTDPAGSTLRKTVTREDQQFVKLKVPVGHKVVAQVARPEPLESAPATSKSGPLKIRRLRKAVQVEDAEGRVLLEVSEAEAPV